MSKAKTVDRVSKRLRTRDRLLVAAQELLLEKSAPEISIRAVTDRAGVVHATFYNYYRTTAELFDGVSFLVLATYGAVIDRTLADITEPAARMVTASRQTMRIINDTPNLGKLLFDSGLRTTPLLEGIRARIAGDIHLGLDEGVFHVDDVELVISAAASMGFGLAMDIHEGRLPSASAERVALLILPRLGVPEDEVRRLLDRRLPDHGMPAVPLSLVEQTLALEV